MVTEQEEYDGQEEGEYHFSDEQITDETGETVAAPVAKTSKFKDLFAGKMGNMRRVTIGGIGLLILVYLVYKMLMPSAPKIPATEITQAKPMSTTVVTTQTKNPMTTTAASTMPQAPGMIPSAPPTGSQQVMPTNGAQGMPPAMMQVQVSGQQPPPMPPQQSAPKEVMDKLAALEQNMQVAATSEAEYSQKMTSYEEKNAAMQAKVDELSTRMASMEASINQLTKLLKDGTEPRASIPPAPLGARVSEPRVNYTVQAIIPGRAWLKSDSGETVTVAEGDTIKDIGRISKIDPYDGVVQVDVGNKIITLTYGGNTE